MKPIGIIKFEKIQKKSKKLCTNSKIYDRI